MIRPVASDRPSEAFFEASARGAFLVRVCARCGATSGPQEVVCPKCKSRDLEDSFASGRAKVVSWTVAHQPRSEAGLPDDLDVLAIGELVEGPWWWTQIIDADPASVRIGLPLTIDYLRPPSSEAIPVFRIVKENG